MAIGTMTLTSGAGGKASAPLFVDLISFAGDSAYPTGGSAAFEDAVQALLVDNRTILGVIGQDCGGYVVAYDRTNDKLKVYTGDYDPAADAPLAQVDNAADLSGTTFNVLVISK